MIHFEKVDKPSGLSFIEEMDWMSKNLVSPYTKEEWDVQLKYWGKLEKKYPSLKVSEDTKMKTAITWAHQCDIITFMYALDKGMNMPFMGEFRQYCEYGLKWFIEGVERYNKQPIIGFQHELNFSLQLQKLLNDVLKYCKPVRDMLKHLDRSRDCWLLVTTDKKIYAILNNDKKNRDWGETEVFSSIDLQSIPKGNISTKVVPEPSYDIRKVIRQLNLGTPFMLLYINKNGEGCEK